MGIAVGDYENNGRVDFLVTDFGDDYKVLYGEPFASMPTDQGALVVFGL